MRINYFGSGVVVVETPLMCLIKAYILEISSLSSTKILLSTFKSSSSSKLALY